MFLGSSFSSAAEFHNALVDVAFTANTSSYSEKRSSEMMSDGLDDLLSQAVD